LRSLRNAARLTVRRHPANGKEARYRDDEHTSQRYVPSSQTSWHRNQQPVAVSRFDPLCCDREDPTEAMRHIIAIFLQNEAGALTRVAGLFSTRGYNIESLSVAPTDDPTVSRLTLVTSGSDEVIRQIASQLEKLVDVVSV